MQHLRTIISIVVVGFLLHGFDPVTGLSRVYVQASGGQPSASRTWAVVIGVARYSKLPGGLQLQFADQDARAFASAIKAAGVPAQNVRLLVGSDATAEAIRNALGTWLPHSASVDDTVYIFFSGHGYVERDFNDSYLLAYDSDPRNIYSTAISAADIEYIVDHRLKARRVLFLQDAERRDFFGNDQTGRADSSTFASSFSHLASSRPGISLITASSPGEFSWEGRRWGDLGAFTKYVVEALSGQADKDKDGSVTDSELFAYLSDRIPKDTSNKQHPWHAGASQLAIAMTGEPSGAVAASTGATSNRSGIGDNSASTSPASVKPSPSSEPVGAVRAEPEPEEARAKRRSAESTRKVDRTAAPHSERSTTNSTKPGTGPVETSKSSSTYPSSSVSVSPSNPSKPTPAAKPTAAQPSLPTVSSVSGSQPAPPADAGAGSVTAPSTAPAPSPMIRDLQAAIASGRLVEPSGYSAFDIYQKLNRMEPYPAEMADLRASLAGALLKQSHDILFSDATLDLVSVHMDDFKRAGKMLGALRELDPSQVDLPVLQKLAAVDALIALQFYDEAEQSLGPLKESPNGAVQNAFGLMYKGEYDDWRAERAFKRAVELDPKWATPHYNLGLLYEGQNKTEALTEFEQAADLDSDNARFQEALGDEYFHRQQWAKAADAYRKAIAANPSFDVLHTKLGHALFSQGLRGEADKEYKRALELSGRH